MVCRPGLRCVQRRSGRDGWAAEELRELDAPLARPALEFARGRVAGDVDDLITAAEQYAGLLAGDEAARAREAAANVALAAVTDRPEVAAVTALETVPLPSPRWSGAWLAVALWAPA